MIHVAERDKMSGIDPVQLLKRLIRIPSTSGHEEPLARQICSWAQTVGLPAERAGRNVVFTLGPTGGKRLLLNSHLDTVTPVSSWETDPFSPVTEKEKIIGLGANDAKGCVTAMLGALAGLDPARLGGQVVLALTVDEETGETGDGLEKLIGELGQLDAAVIGEPTNLDICLAQKGRIIIEVVTTGEARHAAHAHKTKAKNAIVEASQAIMALAGWNPWPSHPVLGPTTCQMTVIDGGTAINIIPDSCVFTCDIRTTPQVSTEEIVEAIQARTGAKVRILSDRMKPFETDKSATIVRAAQRSRPAAELVASAAMSDAVWTRHIPTIKVGPGQTERSHTAGEYITVHELLDGAAFYERLIREFLL